MKERVLRYGLPVAGILWMLGLGESMFAAPAESSPGIAGDGLILWRGGECEVVDAARLQAAFVDYLAAPAISAESAESRKALLRQATSELGSEIATPAELGKAYMLLQQLAADPLDGRRCRDLLRAVVKASSVISRQQNPASTEAALRRKREILSWNVRIEKKRADELLLDAGPPKKGRQSGSVTNAPVTTAAQQLEEVENELSMMELGGDVGELQVRLELQDLALRFLERGDYPEAILAVRFYRGLFGERNPRLRLGPEAVEEIQPEGSVPMLGEIERLAIQALAGVTQSLSDCSTLLQANATVEASKRLATAFAQAGRTVDVLSFPGESKERILKQVEGEREASEFIEKKDFDAALAALARIENDSSDFDSKAMRASIESAKSVALVHLAAAKRAGEEGKGDLMMSELKQSADFWPGNPELARLIAEYQGNARMQADCATEFDRLMDAHNDEEIEKERGRFASAFTELPARQAQLAEVLGRIREVRESKQRAQQLRDFGSLVAAWELADSLCSKYPERRELVEFRNSMLPGVEGLAEGLEKTRSLENKQPASALALYLQLKERYSQSSRIQEGIDRVTSTLLRN